LGDARGGLARNTDRGMAPAGTGAAELARTVARTGTGSPAATSAHPDQCGDLFGGQAARASECNLALSSGITNLLLSAFGAMPMSHGAGGLQAQYRFGARTGLAPILLGAVLLLLALGFADMAAPLFAVVPIGAVGALLIMAGADLAVSRRLFD